MIFDPSIVFLSICIAVISFYLSFDLIDRLKDDITPHKKIWAFIATFSMGIGIWVMHFYGMLAFERLSNYENEFFMILITILISFSTSYFVIKMICKAKRTLKNYIISGIMISGTLITLHHFSMNHPFSMNSITSSMYLLIGGTFITSTAFYLVDKHIVDHTLFNKKKMISSLLMGVGLSLTHLYSVIQNAQVHSSHIIEGGMAHLHDPVLIISVTLVSLMVLIPTIFVAHYDRIIMWKLAYHDTLTEIPNRRYAENQMVRLLKDPELRKKKHALLFIDCDRLKYINDTYGHQAGDVLLKVFSERLKFSVPEDALIARMGGDEFIVFLQNIKNEEKAEDVAKRVIGFMKNAFHYQDERLFFSSSIGIKIIRPGEYDKDLILQQADKALYYAKDTGRNNYKFYCDKLDENKKEINLTNNMRAGLENGEFYLCFQPQYSLSDRNIVSMEALLRWNHPKYGLISPMEFIPIAEKNGFILELTKWVLRESCKYITDWRKMYNCNLKVAVNISLVLFQHYNVRDMIINILKDIKADPSVLTIEITESVFLEDTNHVIKELSELKAYGVSIAIDDFGTGFSSLSYIRELPINTIKIDKQFIKNAPIDLKDSQLVELIVKLANTFELNVIAEGVETIEQVNILEKNKCNHAQGYYFSKPISAQKMKKLLSQNKVKTKA
jgi:diguanylate cyclase